LAPVRVGSVFEAVPLDVKNSVSAVDAYSESLNVGAGVAQGMGLSSGSVSLVAPGETRVGALRVGMNASATSTSGLKSGKVGWRLETDGRGSSGLSSAVIGEMALNVSGQVYDGKGAWMGGSGAWADWSKWTIAGGRPGMDGAASIASGDTASIASGTISLVVALPGSTLNLANMSLTGSGGVVLNGGGTIALAGRMSAEGGSHVIDAEVLLAPKATVFVDGGAKLSISGLVNAGALSKQGAGTLVLASGYRVCAVDDHRPAALAKCGAV
jgi:hypothetical protein